MDHNPLWDHAYVVIMAGGVGSRFWPLSQPERPKQLLDLFGDGPMLRKTVDRLVERIPYARQLVVTNAEIGDQVRALLPELPAENILEEPVGRNTAAAIGWAVATLQHRAPGALVAILPADHHIHAEDLFREDVGEALAAAQDGYIVTIGIPPTRPETGYGYIRRGEALKPCVFRVDAFREKPDVDTAARYLADGDHLWNAGMFFTSADQMVDELNQYEPELMASLLALGPNPTAAEIAVTYPGLKSISIDYAVMERSPRVAMVPARFGWSDVGSWATMHDFRTDGESSFRRGCVAEIDGTGNVLYADQGAIGVVDMHDVIVVRTEETTLVCPRSKAQRVRELVAHMKAHTTPESAP